MRGVGNGRDQARIDHRRSKAEKKTADKPPFEPARGRGEKQAAGLDPHSGDDQTLATPAIAQGAADDLQDSPCRGIDRLQDAYALDAKPEGYEEQWENERGQRKNLAEADRRGLLA